MIFFNRVVIFATLFSFGHAFASDLEGQIFIVTKGQQTIRLPLVSVSLVPQKQFKEFIDVSIKGSIAEIKETSDQVELKRTEYASLRDSIKISETSAETNPFVEFDQLGFICSPSSEGTSMSAFDNCLRTDKGKAAMERMTALAKAYKDYFDQRRSLFREMAGLMDKHRLASKAIRLMIFSAGASDGVSVKSDVDGRFIFEGVKPGSYMAIARANRSIGDNSEIYEWIVEVNVKSKGKNLLVLANDNLLSESCSACLKTPWLKTYPPLGVMSNPSLVNLK